MEMSETDIPLTADSDFDDLPRTLRRERERQSASAAPLTPAYDAGADHGYSAPLADDPVAARVTHLDIGFFRLMAFLLKAVIAAIPALLLLGVVLWFAGQALQAAFPELIQMKILISFPGGNPS
jgi:hypothetical protein